MTAFNQLPSRIYVFKEKAITDKKVLAKLSRKKPAKGKKARPGSGTKKRG